jgi:uncharacterized protein (DUF488 family)
MVYSIGYGNRTFEVFVELLKSYKIQFLLDVRSIPKSKFNESFNSPNFYAGLKKNQIKADFFGDMLGGRPIDRSCYDKEGKVVYNILSKKEFYLKGIERVINANDSGYNVVLMCSELDPIQCHRTKLIGRTLKDFGVEILHINHKGIVETQTEAETRLMPVNPNAPLSLFPNDIVLKSRKSY